MSKKDIELAAQKLARANAESEASISRIYWFPDDEQIRLVEIDQESIKTSDQSIRPFYFNPVDDVPFPSGVALIHPDEVGKKSLPKEWNVNWSSAKLIFDRETEGS
jgi:hypothetical protein